jgi:hypothetical protein
VLKLGQRIQNLESKFGMAGQPRHFVHKICFVDGNGKLHGTMVVSSDPHQCVAYQKVSEENGCERQ